MTTQGLVISYFKHLLLLLVNTYVLYSMVDLKFNMHCSVPVGFRNRFRLYFISRVDFFHNNTEI